MTDAHEMRFDPCLCIVGLIPSLLYAYQHWIPSLLLLNGVVMHGCRATSAECVQLVKVWDICCNVVMGVIVNYFTGWQPYTLGVTIASSVAFLVNDYYVTHNKWLCAVIHVLCTQLPLQFCMVLYIQSVSVNG